MKINDVISILFKLSCKSEGLSGFIDVTFDAPRPVLNFAMAEVYCYDVGTCTNVLTYFF